MKNLVLTATFVIVLATILGAQSITARIDGNQLHILAPRLRFLTGEALNRLHDGVTVKYELRLEAKNDKNGTVLARAQEQFAVSYDLWEEKFAVTKLGASPRSLSHLSAVAAEAWCVDNITIPIAALSPNQPFWLRLDYRAEDSPGPKEQSDNSGFTLTGLIDIFSRRTRSEQIHGSDEAGPLRLESLKRK